jgi:Spy/CpxP family protein refolding chaperone
MKRLLVVGVACGFLHAGPLWAQHDHHDSPYAGQEASEIPSLTDQELADLLAGAGMGMAKPAELNHYPGPKHVLELADDLQLSQEQRDELEEIRSTMLSQAIEIGEQIIEAERILNQRFAHEHIDEDTLEELTGQIAELYGQLRYIHLAAHLTTKATLTADQVAEYDDLRGYASDR